jgi:hypothetical protein
MVPVLLLFHSSNRPELKRTLNRTRSLSSYSGFETLNPYHLLLPPSSSPLPPLPPNLMSSDTNLPSDAATPAVLTPAQLAELMERFNRAESERDELRRELAAIKAKDETHHRAQRRQSIGIPTSHTTSSLTEPVYSTPLPLHEPVHQWGSQVEW